MIFEAVKELTAQELDQVRRLLNSVTTAASPQKTLLVTSAHPGEGKTTTVVNTAVSLAQLGTSVLIVDCDMRKSFSHKVLGVDNDKGLSTYLSSDIEIDGLIAKLEIPNLSFLPCGPSPPNPAELISSERMKNLLQLVSERYDQVLIDSPSLIQATDPLILSTLVDGVILVVHGGMSTRETTQRATQELGNVGAVVFGVLLNNVDSNRLAHETGTPRITDEEFEQRLLKKGIITRIPPRIRDASFYAHRQPIEVEGKPVSEIIIEERR